MSVLLRVITVRVFASVLCVLAIGSCAGAAAPVSDEFRSDSKANGATGNLPLLRLSDGHRDLMLLGTIHAVPKDQAEALSLPEAVYDEIKAADLVLVESNILTLGHNQRLAQAIQVQETYLRASPEDGRPALADYLQDRDESLVHEFSEALAERLPALREHQMETILGLRPWAARSNLGTLRRAHDGIEWSPGLDTRVVQAAREAGVEVRYLESWKELAALHDSAEQEGYVEELLFSVMGPIPEEAIAEARRDQVLEILERRDHTDITVTPSMVYEQFEDVELSPALLDARRRERRMLFETREQNWMPRLLSHLEETEARRIVVAVGAAHVASEAAVLSDLLREAGFRSRSESAPL